MKVNHMEEFKISLESFPSTGYEWTIKKYSNFELVNNEFIKNSSKAVGSGGKQVFYFRGTKVGKHKIIFSYKRPWETTTEDKEHIVEIEVNEKK